MKQETHICKYCKSETTQSDDQCYDKPKQETLEPVKDLAYWKNNAEEDYLKVPISVLRYITELEKKMYSEEEVLQLLLRLQQTESYDNLYEWFEKFKKK